MQYCVIFLVWPGHIATYVWYCRMYLYVLQRSCRTIAWRAKILCNITLFLACLGSFGVISEVILINKMTYTWSNEKIIDFINEVHLHPELWNVETGIYKDRNAKKDGWAVISEKFGITSDEAYKKFRSLRTYAKNEEKKKIKSGSAGGKVVKWFAFDAISFILTQDTPNTGLDSENATQVSIFIIVLITDNVGTHGAKNISLLFK